MAQNSMVHYEKRKQNWLKSNHLAVKEPGNLQILNFATWSSNLVGVRRSALGSMTPLQDTSYHNRFFWN